MDISTRPGDALGFEGFPLLPGALAGRLRPLAGKPAGSLVVHEIYRSLQGESTHVGLPCTFVRLTACHLRCTYCDTAHAFNQGETLPIAEVVARVLAAGDRLVEVTGGEPLLQPEAFPLMAALADAGRTVLLETSGAVAIGGVDPRVAIILDVKTPGSGESAANIAANLALLKPIDEVKYVISDRADFDWAVDHAIAHDLTSRVTVLVGAVHGKVDPTDLAAWVLETGLPLRLQIQLHKLLWGPETRASEPVEGIRPGRPHDPSLIRREGGDSRVRSTRWTDDGPSRSSRARSP